MKLGIIADTHDNLIAISKAVDIFNDESIELLIHAGDFVAPFTARSFKKLKAPLVGVFGNNDGDKLLLKELYKENGIGELHEDPYEFELAAKKIIITHKPLIVKPLAASGIYDAVVYGHTHKAVIERYSNRNDGEEREEKTVVINPGECCGYITGRKTVAILDLEKEEAKMLEL
ncbi:MAG TPA: metallophosphoesterase [Candidatus Bathyarchaeia archaeon]|nr:metallophosphoesterase [Candidatus Bathyarchaeia archaeon]